MATLAELVDDVVGHQLSKARYGAFAQKKLIDGQRYVTAQTDFREFETYDDISMSPVLSNGEVTAYALPDDFQRLISVLYYPAVPVPFTTTASAFIELTEVSKGPFDLFQPSTGTPSAFKVEGGFITPLPARDVESTLRVCYYRDPAEWALNDEAELPLKYQYLLVHYALKFCFERENDLTQAQYHWTQFQEGLMKCRTEVQHDTNVRGQATIIGGELSAPTIIGG